MSVEQLEDDDLFDPLDVVDGDVVVAVVVVGRLILLGLVVVVLILRG